MTKSQNESSAGSPEFPSRNEIEGNGADDDVSWALSQYAWSDGTDSALKDLWTELETEAKAACGVLCAKSPKSLSPPPTLTNVVHQKSPSSVDRPEDTLFLASEAASRDSEEMLGDVTEAPSLNQPKDALFLASEAASRDSPSGFPLKTVIIIGNKADQPAIKIPQHSRRIVSSDVIDPITGSTRTKIITNDEELENKEDYLISDLGATDITLGVVGWLASETLKYRAKLRRAR
ncbi:hypothetical protein IFR05_016172 [Cadophora sp. M221]|nr:hypothetical protein IFR05_016172 [Cadophora sp. M221]